MRERPVAAMTFVLGYPDRGVETNAFARPDIRKRELGTSANQGLIALIFTVDTLIFSST